MKSVRTFFLAILALGFATVVGSACSDKPKYPACESSDDCTNEETGKVEYCVNKSCQECRDDGDCSDGKECAGGRCEVPPECRRDTDCEAQGLVCRANACVPECNQNEDCSGGWSCEEQKCVAACETDIDCGPGMTCIDGGCQAATSNISGACIPTISGQIVSTRTVMFDFNAHDLTADGRTALDEAADCLRQAPDVKVVLEGHCDERGTQEYNLALGEKRAATVKRYLRNLGIDTSRLLTRSKGENVPVCRQQNETCYERNRRVEFIQSRSSTM